MKDYRPPVDLEIDKWRDGPGSKESRGPEMRKRGIPFALQVHQMLWYMMECGLDLKETKDFLSYKENETKRGTSGAKIVNRNKANDLRQFLAKTISGAFNVDAYAYLRPTLGIKIDPVSVLCHARFEKEDSIQAKKVVKNRTAQLLLRGLGIPMTIYQEDDLTKFIGRGPQVIRHTVNNQLKGDASESAMPNVINTASGNALVDSNAVASDDVPHQPPQMDDVTPRTRNRFIDFQCGVLCGEHSGAAASGCNDIHPMWRCLNLHIHLRSPNPLDLNLLERW